MVQDISGMNDSSILNYTSVNITNQNNFWNQTKKFDHEDDILKIESCGEDEILMSSPKA